VSIQNSTAFDQPVTFTVLFGIKRRVDGVNLFDRPSEGQPAIFGSSRTNALYTTLSADSDGASCGPICTATRRVLARRNDLQHTGRRILSKLVSSMSAPGDAEAAHSHRMLMNQGQPVPSGIVPSSGIIPAGGPGASPAAGGRLSRNGTSSRE